jgi:uncharacterized protein YndB with AHSA1/START domain
MISKGNVIEREVFIAASPQTVFGFLTDAHLMAQWIGSNHRLDPRQGGIFQVEVSRGNIARGVYTEITPFRRVAFTWGWDRDPAAWRVAGRNRARAAERRHAFEAAAQPLPGWPSDDPRGALVALSRATRGLHPQKWPRRKVDLNGNKSLVNKTWSRR